MTRITWPVALALIAILPPPGRASSAPDHLACYKVKDPAAKATYLATVSGLAVQAGCKVRVPAAMACTPASKTNVSPVPPGGGGVGKPNGFTCYKVKCPKAVLSPLPLQDQFGTRSVTPTKTLLLCAPDAGPADGGFPATGLTHCWDSSGTSIPCAGTGQDGDIRAGAALAHIDNGDGTITDVNTGLMWEKKSRGDGSIHDEFNGYTWDSAFSAFIATLNSTNFAGHNDWRLPNYRELNSIVDLDPADRFAPHVAPAFDNNCFVLGCTVLQCSCTLDDETWTSTTYVPSLGGPFGSKAWVVNFSDGTPAHTNKGPGARAVRAVRGGS